MALRQYSHFSNIYVGLNDGSYFMASQHDRDITLKYIDGQTKFERRVTLVDSGQDRVEKNIEGSDYDPRQRPWYIRAEQEIYNLDRSIYILYQSKKE